jgi:redox-sensitive bicupin YhaK (pirin superfamily)
MVDEMVLLLLISLLLADRSLSFSPKDDTNWRPLPHVERRDVLLSPAAVAASALALSSSSGAIDLPQGRRSVISLDSHPAIPVWPSWGRGKVVPISLGGSLQDPFLLLAHHDHWFDPRDPLRGPFRAVGKALGLPYVDVEGFSMHPHRGFDIFTYILDGSDGFQHRDNLGATSKLYRGGTCQWMRTGSGVMHEEFWETNPKNRTNIELFQLWVNVNSARKFDEPVIEYIGKDTDHPWIEKDITDPKTGSSMGSVRDISATLDKATISPEAEERTSRVVHPRPPLQILHTKLKPGAKWNMPVPAAHSAVVYVRSGTASIIAGNEEAEHTIVETRRTATFAPDGDLISIENNDKKKDLDMLVLTAQPLREPVASAGPIVMNTADEVNDAYQQLQDGTFLNREIVLQKQRLKNFW